MLTQGHVAAFEFNWSESTCLKTCIRSKTHEYGTLCPVILGVLIKILPCLSLPGFPRSSHSPKNFENETIKGFSHTIWPNYFFNVDFPEIRGFPFLSYLLGAQVVWGRYNLTRYYVTWRHWSHSKTDTSQSLQFFPLSVHQTHRLNRPMG